MNFKTIICILSLLSLCFDQPVLAQGCGNLGLQWQADIPSVCGKLTLTMQEDNQNRPYLYIAEKSGGLKICDISNISAPVAVDSISDNAFDTLDVMSLTQSGNYLYLALGNTFGTAQQPSGMAIVDVTNPTSPVVTDVWKAPYKSVGGGIVKVQGNYAYLGAMGNGLIILDVTNKNSIQFVSQYIPDLSFPTANPDTAEYNARGMAVNGDIVYLCFDAGGFRIINVANKQNPVETGRYSNAVLNNLPRAYNNVVLNDTLAYVAVDYCGIEILDVADTSNIKQIGWWNSWNCQSSSNNWFNSPGYTNELSYDKDCKLIFVATGRSDMYVVNVADPTAPDSCDFYGGTSDNKGTWGLSSYKNNVFLSFICSAVPFGSNWTGVKIFTYTPCSTGIEEPRQTATVHVYPVPATDQLNISTDAMDFMTYSSVKVTMLNTLGQQLPVHILHKENHKMTVDVSGLSNGIYLLQINAGGKELMQKWVK